MSSKSTSTSKSSSTPNAATASLFNPLFQSAKGLLDQPFKGYEDELSAGMNETQIGARDLFSAGKGAETLGQAKTGARGLIDYNPMEVTAGQFAGSDLGPYMNPYEDQVVQGALGDVERQRAQAINGGSGDFTKAGAWGGSRHGVADSLTNEAALRTAANTSGTLRSQGFDRAAGLLGDDLARKTQADLANQSADLSGAGVRAGAAGLLGSFADQEQGMALRDVEAMNTLGSQEQALEQSDLDRQYQEFLREYEDRFKRAGGQMGLIGSIPGLFAGATTKGKQTQSTSPNWTQIAGTAAQAASMFSDARLKTDVRFVGEIAGRRWYDYRYVWDADTVHRGVMAQELLATDPEAVSMHETGYLMVDYGKLH